MVTEEGRPLTGENIFNFLQSQSASTSQTAALTSDVSKFCKKLDEVNIGVLTYGLAFHTKHTQLLRFPYCKEEFFEKVIATSAAGWDGPGCRLEMKFIFLSFQSSNYILTRAERLNDAADLIRPENPDIATQLRCLDPILTYRNNSFSSNIIYCRDISNDHQENLPSYIDEEGYEAVLKTLEKILDFFEDELGRDDRQGIWLGGAQLSLADVTLGV